MKIIGTVGSDNFLVEVGKNELANMVGFASSYDRDMVAPAVGVCYPIGKLYGDAKAMLSTHAEATEAAKKLASTATKFLSFFQK